VISKQAMELLQQADWKGNVRELKNVLESAIVMSRGDTLVPEDFSTDFLRPGGGREVASSDVGFLATDDYREARRQFEIAFIKGKLREHGGNITKTAAAIGLEIRAEQD
jgi:DNA-binding NtrC family response regulator